MSVAGATCLVTGAAGFIGSHLVDRLLNEGAAKVVALDSLKCGRWDNVRHLDDPRVQQVELDFSKADSEELETLLQGVDYLFHLAAEKHNQSKLSPYQVMAVNIEGTWRLFDAAVKAGVRKVVFTSSLYAYGSLSLPAMAETQLPSPRTVYGISKLTGEHMLHTFHLVHGLSYTVARLLFVYGPRQYAGMGYKSVILSNYERVLDGEAPVIFGDGEQALDYVYVDDVTRALILCLDSRADGEVVNIGSGAATSINELTRKMLNVAGSDLAPVYGQPDWTAGSHRVCVNGKARQVLGWQPAVPLDEGLSMVYRWMKSAKQG